MSKPLAIVSEAFISDCIQAGAPVDDAAYLLVEPGSQFTCLTGTKVQILTRLEGAAAEDAAAAGAGKGKWHAGAGAGAGENKAPVAVRAYLSSYYMCPHTTMYVSSYLILVYICPQTTIHVSSYHYVSSYYYACVLILFYVSSYYHICVLTRLCVLTLLCVLKLLYVSNTSSLRPHTLVA
jgi:hypothetical protein